MYAQLNLHLASAPTVCASSTLCIEIRTQLCRPCLFSWASCIPKSQSSGRRLRRNVAIQNESIICLQLQVLYEYYIDTYTMAKPRYSVDYPPSSKRTPETLWASSWYGDSIRAGQSCLFRWMGVQDFFQCRSGAVIVVSACSSVHTSVR